MWYLNRILGHACGSCPRSSTCPDHKKDVCPGPEAAAATCPPRPARLGLETLEGRELFSANPIVAENLLPGNSQSEWDVVGAGDTSIQGYTTDISVDQGQTVSFKVDNPALASYHIDIYRLGYYGGLGARKVATIPSSQTIRKDQPAPLTDAATGLVDAGNWTVTASWAVPTTATSGIYIGKLVREDTGGASHMVFVVRDDDGGSDLLFQTSDTTWQAYNNWGGKSTYDPSSDDGFRAYKVSYNRPLTLRGVYGGLGETNGPFWSEYPMVRWLEANGYNVSYSTGIDTDRRGAELLEHKVFMSVGHDEYWSAGQRASVEAAREAGVNLAFFSGNQMYWKVRWENSIDASGTPYRTMVSYKESTVRQGALPNLPSGVQVAYVSGVEDPSSISTGLWRDLRFPDAAVEQLVSGQLSSVNRGPGGIYGTSIKVPAEFSQLRMWRNTSIANLQPGQVATLSAGTLGYEWDEAVDTGYRPAGLFEMSSTTEDVPEKFVDPISWPGCGGVPSALCASCRGCAVAAGTATHTLTTYRAPSGALVFGAGTIQWSWGLDGVHDGGGSTPDARVQQATVNIFADMGVSAGALRAGLVQTTKSTDLVRPTSVITAPAGGGSYGAGSTVTVTGTAADAGGGVVAGVEVSTDGGRTWRKATGKGNWTYSWTPSTTGPTTILSRAVDDNGNLEVPTAGVAAAVTASPTSTTGLVASYNFNAGSGTTLADNTGTNHGTISNATWAVGGGRFGGNALSFNGTNAWVTVPDAAALDLTTGMTLEAWVKPSATTGYGTILFKETSGTQTYALYARTGSSQPPGVFVNTVGAGEQEVKGPTALPANAWSHLTTTYDGQNLVVYVNGVLAGTQALTAPMSTSNGVLRIGGNAVFGDYFSGLIDDVRVYNRALTQGEILTDMSTPIGGAPDATAPTVSVTAPPTSTALSGVVTLTAPASDNVTVAGVQFLINGVPLGVEDTTAPFQVQWNTAAYPDGSYLITARARDAVGNTTTSAGVPLPIDNPADTTPPTAALTGLTPNAVVSGSVVLRAAAGDSGGVAGVQFKANGVNIGAEVTAAPFAVLWDTSGLSNGTYSITAVARDAAGNSFTSSAVPLVVDSSAPTVTQTTPAAGATVPTDTNPTATFSEAIRPETAVFVIKDAGGNTLASHMLYDATTRTVTLAPNATLTPGATYTVTVSGAKDVVGNAMVGSASWSFTTDQQITGATIWGAGVVPANPSAQNDGSPIEVGLKFSSAVGGTVTGVRFYKGAGNTGTHVGHLWTSSGTLLGSVTFTNETATGWQEALFAAPIAIAANTTYVVSYYAPNGHYAFDSSYFASAGVSSYPLQALSNAAAGGNGLFTYATGGGFPTGTYQAANYWVDVVFSTSTQDTTAPAVAAQSPAPGAATVSPGAGVSVTFSEPVQQSSITFTLRDAGGSLVPATLAYNDATATATLTPTSPLATAATYTAAVSGVRDAAGNQMAGTVSWSFATSAPASGSSVWTDAAVPAVPATQNDTNSIEVGMKFRSDTAGYVTGLRFYKGVGNTGTHVGHLWTGTGTLLASATFTDETASGWQQVTLSSPVPIAANTTYVVSYLAPNGRYAFDSGYFATAGVDSANLHALANGVDGGNGLFVYTTTGAFPTGTYLAANYWVDVTFSTTAQDQTAPSVAARTPAPGATAVPVASAVTVTFSEPVQPGTVMFVLKDPAGNTVPASVAYNASTQTATLTPTGQLAVNTAYTATVGATDLSGNAMAAASWSFNTPNVATGTSLFPDTAVPAIPNAQDTNPIEVGVRFYSEVGGEVTGLRFYKGPTATGTHVGHLWANDGTLLASVTFTNETASGWQQATFSNPVTILPNTLYVASYYAPSGRYSADFDFFATTGVTSGYLHAPVNGANGGNGLYGYAAGGGFPTNTYRSVNYWVDVLFTQGAADTTAPTVTATTPAAGATGVAPTSPLTVTFNEPVQPGTITVTVRDSFNAAVAGNLSYNPQTHVATFIPAAPLLSFMTYTVAVSGVKDLSGNTIAAPVARTFTTQGVWTQTSVSDFASGSHVGTVVTNTAGGEIKLAPQFQEEFTGTTLDGALWGGKSWGPEGGGPATLAVAGGTLTVGGRAVLSVQSLTNAPLEAVASIGAAPYQHLGLVTSFDTEAGNHWALFSTWYTTDRLFARVNANGQSVNVDIGPRPTGFHTYRVKPTAGGFDFYIDNVLRTSIAAGFQSTVALKVGMSDYSGIAGELLRVERVSYEAYSTTQTGTFTSAIFDAGQQVTWNTGTWTATAPAGTTVTVQVRAGNTAAADGSWSGWATVTLNQPIQAFGAPLLGRYLQYRIILTTTDSSLTPIVDDISFTFA